MVPITEIRSDLRHPLLFEKKNDHEEREDPLPVSRVGLRLCIPEVVEVGAPESSDPKRPW
jgi:hypothetical protein